MVFDDESELKERLEAILKRPVRGDVPIVEDTTDYTKVGSGSILRLEGTDYFVTREAREGRFGITDQPKHWVKLAVEVETGERKVVKLVFHEQFTASLGPISMRCVRSPEKESRVLDFVRGDPRFMQGRTVRDRVGNNVRVIDHINGPSLFQHVAGIEMRHEEYFGVVVPGLLRRLLESLDALALLNRNGLQHGDVRNDHIIIESSTGRLRWIDFDYEVNFEDFDVWSAGNILTYVVGKGIRTCDEVARRSASGAGATVTVSDDDALVVFGHRLANVRKLIPYVPVELNAILMRFSRSTRRPYHDVAQVAADLEGLLDAGVLEPAR